MGQHYFPSDDNILGLPHYITIAGVTVTIPDDANIVYLFDSVILNSLADTFFDNTYSNYQIPTNFKFYPIGCIIKHTGAGTFVLYAGSTPDATTTLLGKTKTGGNTGSLEWFISEKPAGILSGNFLTHNPGGTNIDHVTLIGYTRPV